MDRKLVFCLGLDSELDLGALAKDAGGDTFGAAFALVFKDFVEGGKIEEVKGAVFEDLDSREETFMLAFCLNPEV